MDSDVYRLINPDIVWYPSNSGRYTNTINWAKSGYWANKVDYVICHDIEPVDIIIMSDKFDYTMKFTVEGPQIDAVFDVKSWEVKPFDATTLIDKR